MTDDTRSCRHCAAPLEKKPGPGRWPHYCSDECRAFAPKVLPAEQRVTPETLLVCTVCGVDFPRAMRGPSALVCSPACQGKRQRLNIKRRRDNVKLESSDSLFCIQCSQPFLRKALRGPDPIYCSVYCRGRRKCDLEKLKNQKPCLTCGVVVSKGKTCSVVCYRRSVGIPDERCNWCGSAFEPKHRTDRNCSDECRAKHRSQVFAHARDVRASSARLIPRPCLQCSLLFKPKTNKHPTYCSRECGWAAARTKQGGKDDAPLHPAQLGARDKRHRRRARMRGVVSEVIDHTAIYQRDGGRCQLCMRKVDLNFRAPHPKSFSLDHIVPVSMNGTHQAVNVRTTHLGCNSSRGNRGTAQPFLL